ncbi:MAG: DivIVA domain-containing protein [Bacilli bacterium]|nr:DivIVA domain-containing protein [Bacilli bacterium]MBR3049399.1 DivIVA domain-containing protein [Bacilli bacterium]
MKKFSYEDNGYNRSEVNQFISDVIKQTEGIIKKCRVQSEEIEKVRKELSHYKSLEENLKTAIIKAEETGDNIKRMAREERELIVKDAKNNASRIVNEALLRAEKIENQADTLERNMKIFKRKLKVIMEQQMAVVEEIEVLELDPK